MNKKAWLDYLYYKIGKQQYDFKVSGLIKNEKGDAVSTRWRRYSDIIFPLDYDESYLIEYINNRQILPCEVVLDYDNGEKMEPIINKLIKDKLYFRVFSTGSRGYHIHLFFNRALSNEEKLKIIRRYWAEEQKIGNSAIALEYAPHWKSGKIKELVYDGSKG